MRWAQITILVIESIVLASALLLHGKPREGKFDFFQTAFAVLVGIWLLWMAGTFSKVF